MLAYQLVGEEGPDHDKRFFVEVDLNGTPVGSGQGRSKKEAEQMAAKAAIGEAGRLKRPLPGKVKPRPARASGTAPAAGRGGFYVLPNAFPLRGRCHGAGRDG